ncbi:helix-turn-helix domain-containing protein [Streptosporangium canum]|uniref:TetR/AcrR family transcriptional regulator n=1 Tax=Streptosporangium canum TaxID=324952 RepID=UPI0033A247FF
MGHRERLLAAAGQCLFDEGCGRTTVRDLASTAEVGRAAIGYHFGSKEELLNQALVEALDADDAIVRARPIAAMRCHRLETGASWRGRGVGLLRRTCPAP